MKMKRSVRWAVLGILMLSVSVLSLSTPSSAEIGVGISVRIGPPALPVYAQPICPGPGYLWTPGYWGFGGGFYAWHPGYWGPHVGFYGGINYSFGYGGVGFFGGEWRGGA